VHSASMDAPGSAASLPYGFAFDIDGVLLHGKQVLPQALRAMSKLYTPDKSSPKIPLAFITNGGGMTERRKAHQLEQLLDVAVTADQVILSHTPYRSLAANYSDKPVLIIGRNHSIIEVAKNYGFNKTVSSQQIARCDPTAFPFWSLKDEWASGPSADRYIPSIRDIGTENNPIKAIFVMTDPSDWYIDLQLIIDVLVGGGVLGRRLEHVPPNTPPVEIFFSNPDLLWANQHPAPRFGQGAFKACVETLYEKVTGRSLTENNSIKVFGKPNPEPYRLVEASLIKQAKEMALLPPNMTFSTRSPLPFSAIYAVGDNAAADSRGANSAGHPWVSMLVKTGVFSKELENCPVDPAKFVVDDVEKAVEAALHHNRSMKWHSMR
jgi:HAD superfamily hydrolase (TIGR01456 family)